MTEMIRDQMKDSTAVSNEPVATVQSAKSQTRASLSLLGLTDKLLLNRPISQRDVGKLEVGDIIFR